MMTDPISDFLNRIRNAMMVRRDNVATRSSKMTRHLADLLKKEGFIEDFEEIQDGAHANLSLRLKYDSKGKPVVDGFKRVSRPGLRVYKAADELPKVRGGLGVAIVSTSKGIMTGESAKQLGVGGEVLCYVW